MIGLARLTRIDSDDLLAVVAEGESQIVFIAQGVVDPALPQGLGAGLVRIQGQSHVIRIGMLGQ